MRRRLLPEPLPVGRGQRASAITRSRKPSLGRREGRLPSSENNERQTSSSESQRAQDPRCCSTEAPSRPGRSPSRNACKTSALKCSLDIPVMRSRLRCESSGCPYGRAIDEVSQKTASGTSCRWGPRTLFARVFLLICHTSRNQVRQTFLELGAGAMQIGLHRSQRDFHDVRDLIVGVSLDVA